MATPPDISPAQPIGATAAPGRVAMGSRFASADRVDGLAGGPFLGINGQWGAAKEGYSGDGGGDRSPSRQGRQSLSTPLVFSAAAAYPAKEATIGEGRSGPSLFLTDLQRGIGIYEYNMKVTAGSLRTQGTVINHYS